MPQTVCCRSFGDYTNEVVQREKCTFRYKAGRVHTLVCVWGPRTELKTRVEGRRWKVPLSLPRSLRPPRRGQYFLCWKPARRRMDFHRRAAFEPFKNGIRFYRIRALSHAEYRRSATGVVFKNSILRPRSSPSATRTNRDALTRVAKSTIPPRGMLRQIASLLN